MMRKIMPIIVSVMLILCIGQAVSAMEQKKSYIELGSTLYFKEYSSSTSLSLSGEYYLKDIYHLFASFITTFDNYVILCQLNNDVKIASIAGYNLGAIVNYSFSHNKYLNMFSNNFVFSIYGNKLFADKLYVTLGANTYYFLGSDIRNKSSLLHYFEGLNIYAGVNYKSSDKLDIFANVSSKVFAGHSNNTYGGIGAIYKISEKLTLGGDTFIDYRWNDKIFNFSLYSNAEYKINKKLALHGSAGVRVSYTIDSPFTKSNLWYSISADAKFEITSDLTASAGVSFSRNFGSKGSFGLFAEIKYEFGFGLGLCLRTAIHPLKLDFSMKYTF